MANIKNQRQHSSLVYSTETGRICPACGQPVAQCACKTPKLIASSDGIVRVSLETKGRRGKGVTVIKGVPLEAAALASLGKQLRTACGSGGTCKEGVIEIQGDHRELVIQKLGQHGWVIKRAGG